MSGAARDATAPLPSPAAAVAAARERVDAARRVVVLTGAGISTDSGIPDFRGPRGVWTLNPKAERMSDIRYYVADAEVRRLSWQSRLAHPAWTAQPNAGHLALVALEHRGKLHALVTQNIDGLHQRAGSAPQRVIEVHGNLHRAVCLSCGGILKSDTISFGQPLVPEVIERALRAAREADLMLAVGSTLQVYPVAGAVPLAKECGARLVILNAQPTPFDDLADVRLTGSISEELAMVCRGAM
jgi:NAD-dependent deacetylase